MISRTGIMMSFVCGEQSRIYTNLVRYKEKTSIVIECMSMINANRILTIIISKFVAKWSGNVRLDTSSSGIPLNRSCFFRSFTFAGKLPFISKSYSGLEKNSL